VQYGGDADYAASTSAPVTETMNSDNPDFTASANPTALTIVAGQSGNLTPTVAPVNGSTQTATPRQHGRFKDSV
jgi:hypothetical protein